MASCYFTNISRDILKVIIIAIVHLFAIAAQAIDSDPLPEPLTLEFALSLANEPHPELLIAEQNLLAAQADLAQAESLDNFTVSAQARARWIDPPPPMEIYGTQDHRVQLNIKQPLLDFGRTRNSVAAAQSQIDQRRWRILNVQKQRRIEIMSRFYDVILADMQFAHDNEAMAVWYIRYDRMRERVELGQASDIDLFKADSEYQSVRKKRYLSQNQQRTTRARLAIALNRPGQLSAKLALPKLSEKKIKSPAVESLREQAFTQDPVINELLEQLEVEKSRLAALDADRWPLVYAEGEIAQSQREIGSNDRWRAGVTIDWPLYAGGAVSARRAKQRAVVQRIEAELEQTKLNLEQQLLELSLDFDVLQAERDERKSVSRYRELYLDRARAIYEMEVKTDLGDAMVELTDAQYRAAFTEFKIALAWAKLEALTGKDWQNE